MQERLHYHSQLNILEIDFSHLSIVSPGQIEQLREALKSKMGPLGRKVYALVNYEAFQVEDELKERYSDMLGQISRRYFLGTARYSGSSLARVTRKNFSLENGIEGTTFPCREKALEAIAHMKGKKTNEEDL